ncbi:MAG: SGNH/GDSL hydrolase family protein [Planctomycetota bacterium]
MKRRRLVSCVLGAVMALVALELALQLGAWIVWSRRTSDAVGEDRCILCVGDSFTYGLGATGRAGSYPRQLEALLRARGDRSAVVNGGWPGQSSREVLLRLPQQLLRHDPKLVCILVGINDPVVRPARVLDKELVAAPTDGFRWRLRLPQVFGMMANWVRGGSAAPAFVGTWHVGELQVTFEPDGRVVLGKDELRWLLDDAGASLIMPTGAVEPMRWRVEGESLTLETAAFSHTLTAGPAPAPGPLARAEPFLASGEWGAAEPLLLEAAQTPELAPAAWARLVRVAVAKGDAVRRGQLLDQLRAAYSSVPDPKVGAELAQALAAAGESDAAIGVAEKVLAAAPDDVRTWEVLLVQTAATSQPARALACMRAVLESARGDEPWRPALLQMRANLTRREQPAAALHDLFAAFLQNGDRAFLVRQVELGAADYSAEARAEVLSGLSDEARTRVCAALADDAGPDGVLSTLRFHLQRMIALCRARKTEVWLLSYPEPDPVRDPLVAGIAAAAGVPFVSLQPPFAELLRTTPRAELFIADGHCTDRGYGVMAAAVASAIR